MRTWQMYTHPPQESVRLKDLPRHRNHHTSCHPHSRKEVPPQLSPHLEGAEGIHGSEVTIQVEVWIATADIHEADANPRVSSVLKVVFRPRNSRGSRLQRPNQCQALVLAHGEPQP
jgi:hypothetical protein